MRKAAIIQVIIMVLFAGCKNDVVHEQYGSITISSSVSRTIEPNLALRIDLNESSIDSLRKKKRIYNSPNVKDLSDDFHKANSDSRLSRELNWNLRERFCKNCAEKKS